MKNNFDIDNFFKPNSPLYKGLEKLFVNKDFFDNKHQSQIKGLAEICHSYWLEQVNNCKGSSIKYILIGEAPPFSEDDVAYVYNPASKNTHWQTRILKAFGIDEKYKEDAFAKLREEGFLLIDLFPYPAKFNKVDGRKAYKELIDLSVEHYLPKLLQLLDDKLNKEVKVAFAMKRFGNSINEELSKEGKLKPGYDQFKSLLNYTKSEKRTSQEKNQFSKKLNINGLSCYKNIIADGSGNPNSTLIKFAFNKKSYDKDLLQRVYVDMDNVLVDFQSGIDPLPENTKEEYRDNLDDVPGIFSLMNPMPNAIDSYHWLANNFDTYILSTAPWNNPSAWTDKLLWVKKHLGNAAEKRLILSHHKNLLNGDYIIDDRTKRGVENFKGEHIHFGQVPFPNWDAVIDYMKKKVE